MKQTITRQYIDHLLKNVKIREFMEDEYNSDFIESKMSKWSNTSCPMPNHDDSNPSFGVNEESNLYNCFGCGVTGDVIKLVQNVEGLEFIEAIQKLSKYAGIEIETTNLDIKYLINEFKSSIQQYLDKDYDNRFPGGLSESGFLIAFADRTKKHIRICNMNSNEIFWVEEIYKKIEVSTQKEEYKQIAKIWKEFAKQSKERISNLESTV